MKILREKEYIRLRNMDTLANMTAILFDIPQYKLAAMRPDELVNSAYEFASHEMRATTQYNRCVWFYAGVQIILDMFVGCGVMRKATAERLRNRVVKHEHETFHTAAFEVGAEPYTRYDFERLPEHTPVWVCFKEASMDSPGGRDGWYDSTRHAEYLKKMLDDHMVSLYTGDPDRKVRLGDTQTNDDADPEEN